MPRRKTPVEKFTTMYEAGHTIYAIGAETGFHPASVARSLRQAGIRMRPGGQRKQDNAERFWDKVAKVEGRCWIWKGKINQVHGYGSFLFHPEPGAPAREWGAHRCAYLLAKGPIPDGMVVMHSCDNRACVNPDHLELGTDLTNMQDAAKKGRIRFGENSSASKLTEKQVKEIQNSSDTQEHLAAKYGVSQSTIGRVRIGRSWNRATGVEAPPNTGRKRGEASPKAKLTEAKVKKIRRLYAKGWTQVELAERFGVIQVTISSVVRRRTWRHIP